MKKVLVLFTAFTLFASFGAFAETRSDKCVVKSANQLLENVSDVLKPLSWEQTSSCGVKYTITAPFCPCSGYEIYLMQQQAQIEIDSYCPQGYPVIPM